MENSPTSATTCEQQIVLEIDSLIQQEEDQRQKKNEQKTKQANNSIERKTSEKFSSLSRLLRGMGATVLIAASLTFLTQGIDILAVHDQYIHIERYAAFLVMTLMLAAAGFFCGLRIKEDKGARTFLAIVAAIIPVHFCQLGGLTYSRILARTPNFIHYPQLLKLSAPDDFSALCTLGLALIFLVPCMYTAFSALLRSEAKRLTGAYLLSNVILLLPTRNVNLSALFAFGLFALLTRLDLRQLAKVQGIKTKEGGLVRIILLLPVLALVARTLSLYVTEITYLFWSMICLACALISFVYVPRNLNNPTAIKASQAVAAIPAALSWLFFMSEIVHSLHISGSSYLFTSYTLPIALILLGMSHFAQHGLDRSYRKAASIVAIGSVALGLLLFPGVFTAFVCITISIATVAYGVQAESQAMTFSGFFGLAFGLIYHLRYAIELYSMSPWLSLAILGAVTVLISSYVERNHQHILSHFSEFKKKIAAWN